MNQLVYVAVILYCIFGVQVRHNVIWYFLYTQLFILNLVFQSTETETRIAGGKPVGYNKFPWHVSIEGNLADGYVNFCSGAIVSDTHILTAASCVSGRE